MTAPRELRWKRAAIRELKKLPRPTRERVLRHVEDLPTNPFPAGAHKLVGARPKARSIQRIHATDRNPSPLTARQCDYPGPTPPSWIPPRCATTFCPPSTRWAGTRRRSSPHSDTRGLTGRAFSGIFSTCRRETRRSQDSPATSDRNTKSVVPWRDLPPGAPKS